MQKFKIHYQVILLLIFILINTPAGIAFGKSGRITNIDDSGNMGNIIVTIRGEGTLWVGCTVYPAGHGKYEVNLDAKKIRGSGKVKFMVMPRVRTGETDLDYIVALWEDKISLRKCEKKYGKGSERCKWARVKGYQMEGRLDRREGTYTMGFD